MRHVYRQQEMLKIARETVARYGLISASLRKDALAEDDDEFVDDLCHRADIFEAQAKEISEKIDHVECRISNGYWH